MYAVGAIGRDRGAVQMKHDSIVLVEHFDGFFEHGKHIKEQLLLDCGNALRRCKPTVKQHMFRLMARFYRAFQYTEENIRCLLSGLFPHLSRKRTPVASFGWTDQQFVFP